MGVQAVAIGDLFQVVPDLWLPGEAMRPVGVRRERERVQVRRDVAGAPGVGVVPPSAADRGRRLQDDEVGHARLAQPDARAEPAEASADDGDAHVFRHGVSVPDPGARRRSHGWRLPEAGTRDGAGETTAERGTPWICKTGPIDVSSRHGGAPNDVGTAVTRHPGGRGEFSYDL